MTDPDPTARPRTRFWHTLRFRFALWTGLLLLLVLASFGAFVYAALARGLLASVDDLLRLNASQAQTVVEIENGFLDIPESFVEGPDTAQIRRQGFILRILTPEGRVLHGFGAYPSLPVTAESIQAAQRQETDLATLIDPGSGEALRMYSVPIQSDGRTAGVYQVGQTLTAVHDTLARLRRTMLVGIPVLILAAALGGYGLAARALAPIDAITRTAQRISAEDLSARLNLPPTDDEVGRLASTFDNMLARLEAAFRRERQFTADASHELRTPLAGMQTILDVVRAKHRAPAEYRQALDDLAEAAHRLHRLVESLLVLARHDDSMDEDLVPVNLSDLLEDVTESLRPQAEEKSLGLACKTSDGLMVRGSRDRLIRLFANLVDNAIKYTEKGGITINAQPQSTGRVRVDVVDTGIGIPAEDLPHIFERFYRVEKSRTSNGAGLGLAIVREIVRVHEGEIEVTSLAGEGTTIRVWLPQER